MQEEKKKKLVKLLAVVFWLAVWQIISMAVGVEVLVASPKSVLLVFYELCANSAFWYSVFFSLLRIVTGFLLAVAVGTLLAAATEFVPYAYEIFYPVLSVIKATPVASFIILTLLWIKSSNVPTFISFLMVVPIVWSNVSTGIHNTDKKLLEMARVFNFGKLKTLKFVYLPECSSYFYTACVMGIGFAWKSGIAAEVISTPKFSVGTNLYNAKIYLETPQLFAWTIVVIIMSMIVEKLFKRAIAKVLYSEKRTG